MLPSSPTQLTLSLDDDLEGRYTSLRECMSARIYARGLTRCAGLMDCSPSHLGEKLAGLDSADRPRGVTLDEFERYLAKTRDIEPVLYLVARFLRDPQVQREEALTKLAQFADMIPGLLAQAGITKAGRGRK